MRKASRSDQLDRAVEAILTRPRALPRVEPRLVPLVRIARALRDLPRDDFRARLKADLERRAQMSTQPAATAEPAKPKPMQALTPYLAVREAPALIEFVQQAFGAEGAILGVGSAGGIHAEYRIGDSVVMIGGGEKWRGTSMPSALHLYVPDADAVYRRALEAGATSLYAPMDQPYGDREAGVRDVAGNVWFIATHKGASHVPAGLRAVTPGQFVAGARKMIAFLQEAFDAKEEVCEVAPDGSVIHAAVRIGDSVLDLGEARPEWPAMPSVYVLAVDDVDACYQRAMAVSGATSISQPKNRPGGAREAGVKDPFGNMWYLAAPIARGTR
jgi:uncharacterized glyoxalase superfamily protein PhnB